MAETDTTLEIRTLTAASDLSANMYNIVQDRGDGQIVVASEAENFAICGVLVNKPAAAGRFASVAYKGRGKVMAGAAINTHQTMLTTNGSGRAIAAGSGDMVLGFALETAAADGDIIGIDLISPFRLSGSATR